MSGKLNNTKQTVTFLLLLKIGWVNKPQIQFLTSLVCYQLIDIDIDFLLRAKQQPALRKHFTIIIKSIGYLLSRHFQYQMLTKNRGLFYLLEHFHESLRRFNTLTTE